MKIFRPVFLFAFTFLLAACSSQNEEEQAKLKKFIESHPHPFELRATDSSIVGKYLWPDTLSDYSLVIDYPSQGRIREFARGGDDDIFEPLVPGDSIEWPLSALGVDSLGEEYGLWFKHSADTGLPYHFRWVHNAETGEFEEGYMGKGEIVDLPIPLRWFF